MGKRIFFAFILTGIIVITAVWTWKRDELAAEIEPPPAAAETRPEADPPEAVASTASTISTLSAEPAAAPTAESSPYALVVAFIDEAGNPVPHGTVRVRRATPGLPIAEGELAEDGTCRLALPGPGPYRVEANAGVTTVNHRPGRAKGELLVAEGAFESALTLHMPALVGLRVAGRVFDHEGAPVAGAKVSTSNIAPPGGGGSAVTDADGAFAAYGFTSGDEVSITAWSRDFGRVEGANVRAPAEGIILRFDAPLTVTGRVIDESGAPVAGAQVEWGTDGSYGLQPALAFIPDTTTDAEGRFTLDRVFALEGGVAVQAQGYAPAIEPLNGRLDGIEVVLIRGQFVEGAAVDENGKPVANAKIAALQNAEDVVALMQGPVDYADGVIVRTDAAGRYRLGPFGPGEYHLRAEAAGMNIATQTVVVQRDSPAAADWTLAKGGAIYGRLLRDGQPVEGYVQLCNYPTSRPRQKYLMPRSDFREPERDHDELHRVGPDGAFRFDNLAPAAYYLIAAEPDHPHADRDFYYNDAESLDRIGNRSETLPELRVEIDGAAVQADLVFGGGAMVEGYILCGAEAVAGAEVSVRIEADGRDMTRTVKSGPDGHYRVDGLTAGRAVLSVMAYTACITREAARLTGTPGRADIIREFDMASDANLRADIDLAAAGAIRMKLPEGVSGELRALALWPETGGEVALPQVGRPGVAGAGQIESRHGFAAFLSLEPGPYLFVIYQQQGREWIPVAGPAAGTIETGGFTEVPY